MTLVLALLGLAAIAVAEIVAPRLAPRYVLGRTLAAARDVSIEAALDMARGGRASYIRVHGRISSEEEFPDEHDRPLVYRRKRIDVQQADGSWRVAASEIEGVPFRIESRSNLIGIDSDELGRGLIVVPRHADGVGADLPAEFAADIESGARARLVVEQISAVEHAFVAGVPRVIADGRIAMSSGNNRPLILSTVEIDSAMRLLGAGQRTFALVLSALVVLGVVLLVMAGITLVIGLSAAPH